MEGPNLRNKGVESPKKKKHSEHEGVSIAPGVSWKDFYAVENADRKQKKASVQISRGIRSQASIPTDQEAHTAGLEKGADVDDQHAINPYGRSNRIFNETQNELNTLNATVELADIDTSGVEESAKFNSNELFGPMLTDRERSDLVASATNPDELYRAIKVIGEVEGNSRSLLKAKIKRVLRGVLGSDQIPKIYGLQEWVEKYLKQNPPGEKSTRSHEVMDTEIESLLKEGEGEGDEGVVEEVPQVPEDVVQNVPVPIEQIGNATDSNVEQGAKSDPDELLPVILTEEKKLDMIRAVTSFEDLYKEIDKIGDVQGSTVLYTPEKLKEIIESVQYGEMDLNTVTHTYGLNEKVGLLLVEQTIKDDEVVAEFGGMLLKAIGGDKKVREVTDRYQQTGEGSAITEAWQTAYKIKAWRIWDEFVTKHPDIARRREKTNINIADALARQSGKPGRISERTAEDTEWFTQQLQLIKELSEALESAGYSISLDRSIGDTIWVTNRDGETVELTLSEAQVLIAEWKKKEVKEAKEDPSALTEKKLAFETEFEIEFGLTKEDFEKIDGFYELNEGQQKLIYANLKEYAEAKSDGFLRETWKGMRAWVNAEKGETTSPDDKNYAEVVKTLVENMQKYGPKRIHEENGELIPDLVDIEFDRARRKTLWPIATALNKVAHQLAKTPAMELESEMGTEKGGEWKITKFFKDRFSEKRKRYNEYKALQESYEESKKELATILSLTKVTDAGKMSQAEIAQKLVELDSRVYGLQFVQTAPEEVQAIQNIPDKSLWWKIGESVFKKENLGYMALGAVGRVATVGFLGFAAAPAWSSAIGGMRAWNKTAAELREKDRMARMEVKTADPKVAEIQGHMREIIQRIETAESIPVTTAEGGPKYGSDDYLNGLRSRLEEYNTELMQHVGTELNVVQAVQTIEVGGEKKDRGMISRMETLIENFNAIDKDTLDPLLVVKRMELLDKIKSRATYMEDKFKCSRVNFGPKEEYANNLAHFLNVLGEAKMILADTDATGKSETEERLKQYLSYREGAIQDRRRDLQIKKSALSALRAGTFSLAGATLSDLARGEGIFKVAETNATEVSNVSVVPRSSTAVTEVESGPPQSPVAEVVKEVVKLEPYTVKSGDTLTAIMKDKVPFVRGMDPVRQQAILKNILDSFTGEEIKSIGLRSENADLIYPGEKVNIERLNEILESRRLALETASLSAPDVLRAPEPSRVAFNVEDTSALDADATMLADAGEVSPIEERVTSASEPLRMDGVDPLRDSMQAEVQKVYHTPESTSYNVAQFKDRFFTGKITDRDWESVRNRSITSFGTRNEDVFGGADATAKRVSLLRTLIESGAGVTPREGETVESFFARGAKVIAESENTLKGSEQYNNALAAYNEIDPSRNYIAEQARADSERAARDLRNQATREEAVRQARMQQRFSTRGVSEPPYQAGDMDRLRESLRSSRRRS